MREVPETIIDQEVGLGILFATLAVALVITVVGITVPVIEAQPPTGLDRVESELGWIKKEMTWNWMPALKQNAKDIQELKRKVHDLEMEMKAGGGGP